MKLIQTGERVKGQVVSNIGEQRLASSSQALLNTATRAQASAERKEALDFDKQWNKAAKEAEEQAGLDAVSAVGAGYHYEEDGADSVYAQQYNKTAEIVALSNIDSQIQIYSKEAATKYASDADGYQTYLNEGIETFKSENNLNENQVIALNARVLEENKKYLPQIMGNSIALKKQEEDTEILHNIDVTSNIATQNAYEGNQKGYEEGRAIFEQKMEAAVMNGSLTAAQAIVASNDMDKRYNIQSISGKIDRGLTDITNPNMGYGTQTQGIQATTQAIDTWYEKTADTGMFSPEELNKQRDNLLNQVSQANKEVVRQRESYLKATQTDTIILGNDVLDSSNSKDKKAVDSFYAQQLKSGDVELPNDIANPQSRQIGMELIKAKKIIPLAVISSINRNSKSEDPMRVLAAVDMITQLQEQTPEVLDQLDKDSIAFAMKVISLSDNGVQLEDSILQARTWFSYDIEEKQELAYRNASSKGTKTAYLEKVDKTFDDFAEDTFVRDGITGSILDTFSDVEDKSMAIIDYRKTHESFLVTTGDYEAATKMTNEALKTRYGITHVGGNSGQVTKYPPELVLTGSTEEQPWINESWEVKQEATQSYLKSRGIDVPKENIKYLPSVETFGGKKMWAMFYIDDSGNRIKVSNSRENGYWSPEFTSTSYGKGQKESREASEKKLAEELEHNRTVGRANALAIEKSKQKQRASATADYKSLYLNYTDNNKDL